jgi:hypothetical protein
MWRYVAWQIGFSEMYPSSKFHGGHNPEDWHFKPHVNIYILFLKIMWQTEAVSVEGTTKWSPSIVCHLGAS